MSVPKGTYKHRDRGHLSYEGPRYFCTVCKITVGREGPSPENLQCIDVVARYVHET